MTPPDWHHLPDNPYNPHAWFVGEPEIGEGCWIGAFTVIDGSGGLTIGRGCDISAGAQIYSHSTVKRVVTDRAAEIERAATSHRRLRARRRRGRDPDGLHDRAIIA